MNEARVNVVAKPRRKRSVVERALVRGGTLFLLLVVLMEWRSREGFNATYQALEQRIAHSPMKLAELPSFTKGFALKAESHVAERRVVTLKWPSLFKSYKLRLNVLSEDMVSSLEYDVGLDDSSKPARPVQTVREPQPGLPAGSERVVAVQTSVVNSQIGGSLMREVVRQGLLIAAHDELGLSTLDPSSGETIPTIGDAQNLPFVLITSVRPLAGQLNDDGTPVVTVNIELSRANATNGPAFRWNAPEFKVPFSTRLEGLTEHVETLSRGPFVAALEKAGFTKVSPTAKKVASTELPPDRLDMISQFHLIRELHSQIADGKETPGQLGRLTLAYANLGSLTDFHWSPASKAFKARALLYSRRLQVKAGATPFSLAHRAYVLALIGRHQSAIDTIKAARSATGTPAPQWLDLIDAYVSYRPTDLDEVDGLDKELALYLRMRMVDPRFDQMRGLEAIVRFLQVNPASHCAAASLAEFQALMVQRQLTEGGYEALWPNVYKNLAEISGLPAECREIAQGELKATRQRSVTEFECRRDLINSLFASTKGDQGFPSWAVLADLLNDESFIEAWRTLHVEGNMLGIPSDRTLVTTKHLYDGHRYQLLLNRFGSDRQKGVAALGELVDNIDAARLELPAFPIEKEVGIHVGLGGANKIQSMIFANLDDTYDQLAGYALMTIDKSLPKDLHRLSPHWPLSISAIILSDWKNAKLYADEWEQKYSDCPGVLSSLATRYTALKRNNDAVRCLKKSIDAAPTYSSYQKLATLYRSEGRFDQWQETLEQALELPSLGLESSRIHMDLAYYLMKQGKWKAAEPHATASAESYSGWGLLTGARCAQGMEQWNKAEAYVQAVSQRYAGSAPEWYYWCVRTGRGNRAEAKAVAIKLWKRPIQQQSAELKWSRATSLLIDGELTEARTILQQVFQQGHQTQVAAGLLAAVLADREGETEIRDKLFREIDIHKSTEPFSELANMFRCQLSDEKGVWSTNEFDLLPLMAGERAVPYLYLVAGLFLQQHQQEELGKQYLENAATTFSVTSLACTLANHFLREQNITPGKTRQNDLSDNLAVLAAVVKVSDRARAAGNLEEAEGILNEILETQPDLLPGLIRRGGLHEERQNYAAAIADYENAIRIDPNFSTAHRELAWLLATCEKAEIRNGPKALEHAKLHAARRKFLALASVSTLAAAYAECGDFKQAAEIQEQARSLAGYAPDGVNWRKLYLEGKPFHRPANTTVNPKARDGDGELELK